MILSDLNTNHGLILPKLTDLDLNESLFEFNEDPILLKTAFYSYRPTEFTVAYDKYVSKVTSQVKLNSNQLTILKSQSSRIKKIAAGYFQSCNNQVMREDIPTSDLYSSFDSDGCAGFKFNPGEVDSLLASCLNDVTTLQNQPDRNTSPTKHDAYDRIKVLDNTHATFKLLNKIL